MGRCSRNVAKPLTGLLISRIGACRCRSGRSVTRKIKKDSTTTANIRLSTEVEARLSCLASRTGRIKAFYLRSLIEEHLDDLKDASLGEAAW